MQKAAKRSFIDELSAKLIKKSAADIALSTPVVLRPQSRPYVQVQRLTAIARHRRDGSDAR